MCCVQHQHVFIHVDNGSVNSLIKESSDYKQLLEFSESIMKQSCHSYGYLVSALVNFRESWNNLFERRWLH